MNNTQLKRINMGFNYKIAEEIISYFNSDNITDELDLLVNLQAIESEELIVTIFNEGKNSFLKPSKYTLLHCFIEQYLYHYLMNERYYLLDELCCDFEVDLIIDFISKSVKTLNEYGIIIDNYKEKILKFDKEYEDAECSCYTQYKELVRNIYDDILSNFDAIKDDIVEAVFYLLYNNKGFLFCFNKYLAKYTDKEHLDG